MSFMRAFLSGGPFAVRRLGRILLWRRPQLYRWFGILRNRGDCLQDDFEVWFGGFPRSANTFCVAAFNLANPDVPIASHWHIPAFIIHGLHQGKPGIFLIRNPVDCVISWTIFWEGRLELSDCLDYYIDFHRTLLPYRAKLFVAPFDQTISNFEEVVRRFNQRFGTRYNSPAPGPRTEEACMNTVEDWLRAPDGSVNEHMVSRPSPKRVTIKAYLSQQLQKSAALQRKLAVADQLYVEFTAHLASRPQSSIASDVLTATLPSVSA